MLIAGCHLSSSRGFLHMGEEALSLGANTFQFFTRNPRGGGARAMDEKDAAALVSFMAAHGFPAILAHAPYTLNACSSDAKTRHFARMAMREDLERLAFLPGCMYNLHPGSHVGQGAEAGIAKTAALLNEVLKREGQTIVLLETMSGKGSEIGGSFEELAAIIGLVEHNDRLGVCLDTCHVFDAGYDIAEDLGGVLALFDAILGLDRLRAIHLNDSMNALGSRKDRHARLGEGNIGLDAFARIVRHPALCALPFLLETPNDLPGYAREIALLKDFAK